MKGLSNPPHPGGILKEELDCLKVSFVDFAKRIGVDPDTLKWVLDEQAPITAELAEKISSVITGPSPDTWLAMQKDYDQWQCNNKDI